MLGYLKAIFDWFNQIGQTLFQGIFDVVRRFKWFFVAVLAGLLAPVKWVLEVARGVTQGLLSSSAELEAYLNQFGAGSVSGWWAQLSAGAALMNCVVPLDLVLSVLGILITVWLVTMGIKAGVWLYRLIPFKAS